MKIGITGCDGFIGSEAADHIARLNYQVIPLDTFIRSYNIEDKGLKDCPDDLDWVLHFAATSCIGKSVAHPFFTYQNNFNSTLSALNIAYRSQAIFLYMSSYVYGSPQYLPIDEAHPLRYSNPYMGSKILGETLCQHLGSLLNLSVIILRGFHIYGNYNKPGRLISDLLTCVRQADPISINDPIPRRDYLYIKDFCLLLSKIISQNSVKTGTYNVGSGQNYSNLEVAEMVRKLSHETRPTQIVTVRRQNDVVECIPDISLIKRTFLWEPTYSLEMGLRELIEGISQR